MTYSLTNPSTETAYTLKQGMEHNGVWALQKFLKDIGYLTDENLKPLAEPTGYFGGATDFSVKRYQRAKNLVADGIVGPKTSAIIVHSAVTRAPNGGLLPRYLIEGVIDAESNQLLGAVNDSIAGGLDLGLTQRRVYGPPYTGSLVARALDPAFSVAYTISNADGVGILDRYNVFRYRVSGPGEYSWRLAALAHNWPSAADTLSRGGTVSHTKRATVDDIIGYDSNGHPKYGWIPRNTKFADGAPVVTYWDWARYYALGSNEHNDPGRVTRLAFSIPSVR